MSDRRQSLRFDKVFTVYLRTPEGMSRGVARNIFLDGNTIRDSHSVSKKRWVGDAAVGVAANFGVYKIAFVRVFRSQEFIGQQSAPRYGSITISGPL